MNKQENQMGEWPELERAWSANIEKPVKHYHGRQMAYSYLGHCTAKRARAMYYQDEPIEKVQAHYGQAAKWAETYYRMCFDSQSTYYLNKLADTSEEQKRLTQLHTRHIVNNQSSLALLNWSILSGDIAYAQTLSQWPGYVMALDWDGVFYEQLKVYQTQWLSEYVLALCALLQGERESAKQHIATFFASEETELETRVFQLEEAKAQYVGLVKALQGIIEQDAHGFKAGILDYLEQYNEPPAERSAEVYEFLPEKAFALVRFAKHHHLGVSITHKRYPREL